jgi:hypothetical protein
MKEPDRVLNKCASILEKLDKQRHYIILLMKKALEEKYNCTLTRDKNRSPIQGAMKVTCKHDTRSERTEVQRTLEKDETYRAVHKHFQKVWTTKKKP